MTIRFTNDWNGYKSGQTRTLTTAEEAAAFAARVAVYEVADTSARPVDADVDPLTGEIYAGGQKVPPVSGARILSMALAGDSLHARNHVTNALTGLTPTYNSATGILTFAQTSHGHFTGMPCRVASSSGDLFRDLTLTRIDANSWSVNIGTGRTLISATTDWFISNEACFHGEGPFCYLAPSRPKLFNCGISGATSQTILRYSVPQAIAAGADMVWLRAGPNDVVAGDLEATYANIEASARLIEAAGAFLLISTIPPFGVNSAGGAFTANLAARIRNLQKTLKNSALVDEHAMGVDPASSTGSARAGYLATDNTHFTPVFAKLIGARVQSILDSRYGRAPSPCPASAMDAYNVTTNPSSTQPFPNPTLATATGGTAGTGTTGTAASGITTFATGAGTPVASVVAAANGIGNAQRLVGTPAAYNDLMRCTTRASETIVAGLLIPGKRYKAVGRLRVTGLTGQAVLQSFAVFVVFTTTEGTFGSRAGDFNWSAASGVAAAQQNQVDSETEFETPDFPWPAGVTSAYIDPQVKFAAAAASPVTVEFSQPSFVCVS
jgi:hypothetical protein